MLNQNVPLGQGIACTGSVAPEQTRKVPRVRATEAVQWTANGDTGVSTARVRPCADWEQREEKTEDRDVTEIASKISNFPGAYPNGPVDILDSLEKVRQPPAITGREAVPRARRRAEDLRGPQVPGRRRMVRVGRLRILLQGLRAGRES